MKRQGLLIVSISLILILMLAFVGACAPQKPKEKAAPKKVEKITLKIIYAQPWTDRGHRIFKEWQDKVNAVAPDRLEIKYLGAYEVIPSFQQMDALMKGTVDMAVLSPTFYTGVVPEAMAIHCIGFQATVVELRKMGMLGLLDEILRAKVGVTCIGSLWAGDRHGILLRHRTDKADLTGRKIRAVSVHFPGIKALGGTVVTIPVEETYTALQTGVMDGCCNPVNLWPDYRLDEVTSYIFYPFLPIDVWTGLNANVKVWEGLPEDVKKIMMDNVLALEPKVDAYYQGLQNEVISSYEKKGMKRTGATSPAEEEVVNRKMIRAQWKEFILDRAEPKWLPRLNAMAKQVLGIE